MFLTERFNEFKEWTKTMVSINDSIKVHLLPVLVSQQLGVQNYSIVGQAATAKTQRQNRYFKIWSRKILLHNYNKHQNNLFLLFL